jgi:hypothetical protein
VRYDSVAELLDSLGPQTPSSAALILRDRKGPHGQEVGLCNDLSINQAIAHHSVIFQPAKMKIWVSTGPWQFGKYVCYDLGKVFSDTLDFHKEIISDTLPRDPAMDNGIVDRIFRYREMTRRIQADSCVTMDFVDAYGDVNPDYYGTWLNIGDWLQSKGKDPCAMWQKALTLPMKKSESEAIRSKIEKYQKKNGKTS